MTGILFGALFLLLLVIVATTTVIVARDSKTFLVARQVQEINLFSDHILVAAQNLAFERGRTNVVLSGPAPVSPANRVFIMNRRAAVDHNLADGLDRLETMNARHSDHADALRKIVERLDAMRQLADRDMPRPRDERSADTLRAWYPTLSDLLVWLGELVANASQEISDADGRFGRLMGIKLHAFQLRDVAGRESAILATAIAANRPLSPADQMAMTEIRREIRFEAQSLRRNAAAVNDPRLKAAFDKANEFYFSTFASFRERAFEAGIAGQPYPFRTDEFTGASVPALDSLADILGAVRDVATDYARMNHDAALRNLWLSVGGGVLSLLIVLLATATIHRRVSRPMADLAERTRRLAQGQDIAADSAIHAGRIDEIGTLARAVDAFAQTTHELREARERYDLAIAATREGIWDWNLTTGAIWFSPQWKSLFGYGEDELPNTLDTWMRLVLPEDAEAARREIDDYLSGLIDRFDSIHRFRHRDGHIVHIRGRAIAQRDASGRMVRLTGSHRDISFTVQQRLALSASEARLRAIFSNSAVAIALFDSRWTLIDSNQAWPTMLGRRIEDLTGRRLIEFIEPEDRPLLDELAPMADGVVMRREIRLRDRRDEIIWADIAVSVIRGTDATPTTLLCVIQDETARKHNEIELIEARAAAESANRAKSEFLSSMSHELRTPLNAVLGFGQLLEYDRSTPLAPNHADYVSQILKAGRHLLALIDEVLDLSRVESGRIALAPETIAPRGVIDESLVLARPLAERRGIQIIDLTDGNLPPAVFADPLRTKQALLNLLSNAIKYNRQNGQVVLDVQAAEGGRIRFSVADTGPGIPPERQEELFQPFNRLGAETTEIEGTGIGLSLTKQLIERMGGRIGFRSNVGSGSVFWFDLPTSDAAPKAPAAVGGSDAPSAAPSPAPAPATTTATDACHRILYIEDDPSNLRLMREILAQQPNIELLTAQTAELGLELAGRNRPALILMDVNLPGIDGIEATRRLKANPRTRAIPVIALSADAMPATIRRGLDAGVLAYLTKPVNVAAVTAAIREALAKAAETRPVAPA